MTSTTNTFEVDILLTINAPAEGVRLKGFSTAVNYNTGILNGGAPCTDIDCGSWSLIPELPTRHSRLTGIYFYGGLPTELVQLGI